MKKLIFFVFVGIFLLTTALSAEEYVNGLAETGQYPGVTGDGNNGLTIAGAVTIGIPNSTESSEVTIEEVQIKNDAATPETLTAYKKTVELSDETADTEDVIVREYMLVAGTLGMYRSSKVYTAAPNGAEAPVYGCIVTADRATWDPASVGSGGAYFVKWDGNSWEVIDGQDD